MLMTLFSHYLLHNYAHAPLPISHGAPEKYRWRNAALEKLEVAEQHSGALRLTLTTEYTASKTIKCARTSLRYPGPLYTVRLSCLELLLFCEWFITTSISPVTALSSDCACRRPLSASLVNVHYSIMWFMICDWPHTLFPYIQISNTFSLSCSESTQLSAHATAGMGGCGQIVGYVTKVTGWSDGLQRLRQSNQMYTSSSHHNQLVIANWLHVTVTSTYICLTEAVVLYSVLD